MIRININNRELTAEEGTNILKIATDNGIKIPNLCYDGRMKPYGACGLCVVEIEGIPKLQRACSTKAVDGMIIKTNTARTLAARKVAFELIASDHRGDCRPPCVNACPAHTDCQGYVGLIANGQYEEAIKLVKDVVALPASIGRVCPHPCETACRRQNVDESIAIADLKRFLGDIDIKNGTFAPEVKEKTGKKVAVVGSGPAGISCAYFLVRSGHQVCIYESMPHPGGMLRYGIPEYRLPKDILDAEINTLVKMGVEIKCNVKLGEDISIKYLKKSYNAVFVAIGAWSSSSIGCKGQDMEGVLGGIDFLRKATQSEKIYMGSKVIVIGGGNTAMDVARTAVRLGADDVQVLYRRTRNEMPAEEVEIVEAEEEGVKFNYLVAPIEITGDGNRANNVRCQRMKLGEPDASGRRKPEPIFGEEISFESDLVISAIGQRVNAESVKELTTTKKGNILVDENTFETNIEGVFAGGEASTGPKIAIEAIAQGKNAAKVIHSYLNGKITPVVYPNYIVQDDLCEKDFEGHEKQIREHQVMVKADKRKLSFAPISETFTEEAALREASRCLECGCHDYFECKLVNYIEDYNVDTKKISGEKHKRKEEQNHPFIERNPDKCILCGQCVRACEEFIGITAIGLEKRGFDSKVIPEFNLPLEESSCISCGQCVDVCPTGACMEKQAVKKQVPVDLDNVKSVCNYCGVGCNLVLQTKGNLVFKSLPDRSKEEGLLCVNGRFGINFINDENAIKAPVVRRENSSTEVTLKEALTLISKNLQLIRGQYGSNSIAILTSPRFTNEEAFVIKKIADKLDTEFVGSLAMDEVSGMESVLGYDASSNSYGELYSTDLIVSVGNVDENHPIMAVKMKYAAQKKAKLVSISSDETRMKEYADVSIKPNNSVEFLKSFIKALFKGGYVKEAEVEKKAVNLQKLWGFVKDCADNQEANKLAKMYGEAKKAIIVADDDMVTADGYKLLADAAVITGKIGKAHSGIITVRSNSNYQGFIDMDIKASGKSILEQIEEGKIKAVVIIGEDPVGADENTTQILKKLKFIATFDMFMTDTALMSNVVVPIASFAESQGTFTRSDRKIQKIVPAVHVDYRKTVFDNMSKLAQYLDINIKNLKQAVEMISWEIPEYNGLNAVNVEVDDVYTLNTISNTYGIQVLYTDGFNKEDKKAVLSLPESNVMFKNKKVYDSIKMKFDAYLKKVL
ncbi:molybdopterin oxidoreductase [Clostridium carboxidivorans P7]|uniref:Molybdopterin oxidoreductase n=1 Tax=Clostridium carboxidivorans P7 TaxID=536227 RepID=C6PV25_9CLOT|nr:FAD-dependent oxidoreductase [Clostridium carboxidivorans]AKN32743.1 molybdopterin oxidoreductase [Clostridium carboxidivorans P7]EET86920.1 molybdopterin oxidoreductase [Clostridium carboxidivorans P7]EFG90019.1 pyridine nucleotide-disulfide oxidoreductase [Clostridium carboxidivorans P7]